MTTATAMQTKAERDQTIEAAIHKLKLQWMMAKNEAEKRKISEEIRRRLSPRSTA